MLTTLILVILPYKLVMGTQTRLEDTSSIFFHHRLLSGDHFATISTIDIPPLTPVLLETKWNLGEQTRPNLKTSLQKGVPHRILR